MSLDFNIISQRLQQTKNLLGVARPELKLLPDEQGLSNGTNLRNSASATKTYKFQIPNMVGLEIYAHDAVVIREGFKRSNDWAVATRGEITEFSAHSRQRLAFVANNTPVNFLSMITLTPPRHFPDNGYVCKWHFDRFMDHMKLKFGKDFEWLFFPEFQTRDAMHFHLMTDINMGAYGECVAKYRKGRKQKYVTVQALHDWASKIWSRVVHKPLTLYRDKNGSIYNKQGLNGGRELVAYWQPDMNLDRIKDHYRSGISFEPLREKDGGKHYVVKYAKKMEQKKVPPGFQHVGRFWGCSKGVRNIKPIAKLVASEPMLKRLLAALDDIHPAVKALTDLPKVLFNVGKVFHAQLDRVKETLIPLNEFRQHLTGFNKPVELREICAHQIMRVFRKMGIVAHEDEVAIEEKRQAVFDALPNNEKIWYLVADGMTKHEAMRQLNLA